MIACPLEFVFGAKASELENYVNQWQDSEFIGTALWETYTPHGNLTRLVELFVRRGIKVTLILNSWCQQYQEQFNKLECNVFYFDFFLWRTYNELIIKKKNTVSTSWDSASNKFLFLTGKPQKPNRIRLLYKFAQNQLLDQCVWSLYVHSGNSKQTHKWVKELNDVEFQQFVNQCSSNPDNADIVIQPTDLHYGGIPYDVNLFSSSKFRVISETSMHNSHPFFTEKTWITILNRLPFIIAGDVNSNQALKMMGFRTFEQHVPGNNYDSIIDTEQRLDTIVEHTKFLLNNEIDVIKVAEDVTHNYNNLITLAIDAKKTLEKSMSNVGIDVDIDNLISTLDDITNT